MESERKITRCMIFFTLKISIGLSVGVKNGVAARVVYRTVTQQLSRIVLLCCRSPMVLLLPGRLFMLPYKWMVPSFPFSRLAKTMTRDKPRHLRDKMQTLFSLFFCGPLWSELPPTHVSPSAAQESRRFPNTRVAVLCGSGTWNQSKISETATTHTAWEAHGGLDHHPDCAGSQDADQPRNASRLANTFELKANDLCLLTMLLLSVYCTCSTSSTRIASGKIIAMALLPAAPCPNVPCSDAAPHLCKVLSESSTMADISMSPSWRW